ncbi:capsular exopolysaccharide synthesis family protein [Georgenia soli]|uniref:Capsular exopolysaccharide synthesis family protein n=1 Tax=Georgenia soli TaxID=638953 RepID=A0A2A9ELK4_9MICO|nr:polysaccharide biosynthesis tyrosine autokinase [Georgenia soli]PFG39099.1 capsular exopolysaccharide synthesis family protein [Georgenia soli]
MELNTVWRVLRARWVTVLAALGVAVLLAAAVTALMPPRYTSTAKMYFSVRSSQSITELNEGTAFTESQMSSLADIATSPLVLDPVIQDLGLDTTATELARSVRTTVPEGTAILQIAATAPTAQGAADLANAVAKELSDAAATIFPDAADGGAAVRATIPTPGAVPTRPSVPNPAVNLVLGVVLGLLAGVVLALVRQARDTHVGDERDLAAVTDATVLASLGPAGKAAAPVFVRADPDGRRAESVRELRTNLHVLTAAAGTRSVVVTSATAGEGATTVAVNLAVALADTGASVLLVDADLRHPSAGRALGVEGSPGLSDALLGRARPEELARRWGDRPVDVLPAGRSAPNPSELLSSAAMAHLLAEAAGRYDMVVVDSPPVLTATDAAVLSTLTGGTLLVVATGRNRKVEMRQALERLDHVGARILGLVLNRVDAGRTGARPGERTPDVPAGRDDRATRPPAAARRTEPGAAAVPRTDRPGTTTPWAGNGTVPPARTTSPGAGDGAVPRASVTGRRPDAPGDA